METKDLLNLFRELNVMHLMENKEIANKINEIEKKLEFADAVLEETGAEIFEEEIEHQLGTVWVGNLAISAIETEEL